MRKKKKEERTFLEMDGLELVLVLVLSLTGHIMSEKLSCLIFSI